MKLHTLILTFGILTNLCGQVNSAFVNALKKELSASSTYSPKSILALPFLAVGGRFYLRKQSNK